MARRAFPLLLAMMLATGGLGTAPRAVASEKEPRRLLSLSANWGYQLQEASPATLAATRYDVLVMDMAGAGSKRALEALKRKPEGGRRLILSYLSVGEAEIYRYYWSICCAGGKRPAWLGAENPRWKGNFRVQFWEDDWKAIIFEDAKSYLKRIVDAGFDGVYLDRIDAHAQVTAAGVDARAEMIRLVQELSAKAKSLKPGFLVVAQNAEDLVADEGYLAAIDGIAKEDLLYGAAGDGRRNEEARIRASTELLQRAAERGKHVMVVEYLERPKEIATARTEIIELGFVPTFAPRTLQKLQVEELEDDGSH